ncbi:MAG: hypothetical protein RJA07_919 [Bacteroidota bacterium]|jgi:hypothetical protein
MKKILVLIFFVVGIAPTYAWGTKGHHIVAVIAKQYLEKGVQDSVQKYLGDIPFEDAATWMDDMRKDKTYDYMKPWHYVNIEKDKTYVKNTEANIINELSKVMDELHNKSKHSKSEISMDLKILFHLIGDIHMPLHVGYASDKGGNNIAILFLDKPSNLHRVWDTEIIETKNITAENCLKIPNSLSTQTITKLQRGDVEKWMHESRTLLETVYAFNENITQDYIDKNAPIVEKQLLLAGVRLAKILNQTFAAKK